MHQSILFLLSERETMALRPNDNALPTTTAERLIKQVQFAVSVQKLPDLGVNDESQPPSADATIDYISSECLEAISDPESVIPGLLEGLDSNDWMTVCESLNDARRLALYHSSLLEPNLEIVMLVIVKAMKNPRSALCKTSIMASTDILKAFGDQLLECTTSGAVESTSDALDSLLLQLLMKASQDKKFVCEEADRALKTMVEFITPLPLLHKLNAYVKHRNPRVRAKAAIWVSKCVSKMGLGGMNEFGLVSLVQLAAGLLNDRLPEAREAARNMVISIFNAFTENEEQKQEAWQNFCQFNLPPIDAQSLVKIISSL